VALLRPDAPCVLWCSGRGRPGVHALGVLAAAPRPGRAGPEVAVRWTLLETPVPRADLLADPGFRDAEVLRMPAGSNPSWLSLGQLAAVLARVPDAAAQALLVRAGTMKP
jgi:hypothetical protein